MHSHTVSVKLIQSLLALIARPASYRLKLHLTMRQSLPIPSQLQQMMVMVAACLLMSQSMSLTLSLKQNNQLMSKTDLLCSQREVAQRARLLKTRTAV